MEAEVLEFQIINLNGIKHQSDEETIEAELDATTDNEAISSEYEATINVRNE